MAVDQKKSVHHESTHRKQSTAVGFLERALVRSKINDDKQPRFSVGRALGHKDTDIITLMQDGSVRYNGSWKCSLEGCSVANDHELQNALGKKKTQNQRCKVVWRANMESTSMLVGNTRSIVDRQFFPLSRDRQLVDGEKRHVHDDGVDHRTT